MDYPGHHPSASQPPRQFLSSRSPKLQPLHAMTSFSSPYPVQTAYPSYPPPPQYPLSHGSQSSIVDGITVPPGSSGTGYGPTQPFPTQASFQLSEHHPYPRGTSTFHQSPALWPIFGVQDNQPSHWGPSRAPFQHELLPKPPVHQQIQHEIRRPEPARPKSPSHREPQVTTNHVCTIDCADHRFRTLTRSIEEQRPQRCARQPFAKCHKRTPS